MLNRTLHTTTALALCVTMSGFANAEDLKRIDIPAQDLSLAIAALGEETGLRVAIADDLADGKTSAAVAGSMTATEALERLLVGTNLSLRAIGEDGFMVAQSNATAPISQDLESEPVVLDDIIVRGELIERTVQDSQTSAVIIPGAELEQRGETVLGQTLQRVPGVTDSNGIVLRGVSISGELGNGTISSTISVSTDGIRLSDYRNVNRTQISNWDVEQVEVLRGPQSTQAGRNALVGAIIVESADPVYVPEYKLRAGASNIDEFRGENTEYQAAFVVNVPVVEDQIAIRLSGDRQESIDGDTKFQTVRGKLRMDPTENLSLGLNFTDTSSNSGFTEDGTAETEIQSPSFHVDFDITDALTLSSRTQFTTADTGFSTSVPFLNATALRDREYETIEQEVRLGYDTEAIRAVGGLFYTNISENSLLETALPDFGSTLVEDIETNNYAVYGEVEYDFSADWTLIAGARYDVENVENTSTASVVLPNGFTVASVTGAFDNTYSAFLPKVGAVYNFNDDISLGATYQRSYRAGGVGVGANAATGETSTFEFDPEFTDTFELAFRSQSEDGTRTINANVFYTRWSDQQVISLDPFGNPDISNAASSRLWGVEAEFSQFVTDDLELFASAAYANTRYNDFIADGVQQAGNEFPSAPEITANFGANYIFSNGLSIGGDVNYTSSSFSDSANTPTLENDDFWVVNLNASYVFDNGAELTAYVRNLLDAEYTTSISPTDPSLNSVGARREVGLLLSMTF
ncbi:MAG: TonB-dependent receptor [Pseudomonadota bacterium]